MLLPQIVYYYYSALRVGSPEKEVIFSVPTGNFGNILAGWMAKKMGLPISRLICGSNQNDILTRFFESGMMKRKNVNPSYSPSMDIQVSSNFERLLYEINDRDTNLVKKQMNDFKVYGNFEINQDQLIKINNLFSAFKISDVDTLDIIKKTYIDHKYVLDPHSAIGYGALQKAIEQKIVSEDSPSISLACAHPAKFPQVIKKSIEIIPEFPFPLDQIMSKKENFKIIDPSLKVVQEYITKSMRVS